MIPDINPSAVCVLQIRARKRHNGIAIIAWAFRQLPYSTPNAMLLVYSMPPVAQSPPYSHMPPPKVRIKKFLSMLCFVSGTGLNIMMVPAKPSVDPQPNHDDGDDGGGGD